MGLTEMQERARDEVVLPYLDAQDEMGLSGGEEGSYACQRKMPMTGMSVPSQSELRKI